MKFCYNLIQIVSDIDASQKPLSTYIFFSFLEYEWESLKNSLDVE